MIIEALRLKNDLISDLQARLQAAQQPVQLTILVRAEGSVVAPASVDQGVDTQYALSEADEPVKGHIKSFGSATLRRELGSAAALASEVAASELLASQQEDAEVSHLTEMLTDRDVGIHQLELAKAEVRAASPACLGVQQNAAQPHSEWLYLDCCCAIEHCGRTAIGPPLNYHTYSWLRARCYNDTCTTVPSPFFSSCPCLCRRRRQQRGWLSGYIRRLPTCKRPSLSSHRAGWR
jgi:hypothetical protein